jgi:hypothetical protein
MGPRPAQAVESASVPFSVALIDMNIAGASGVDVASALRHSKNCTSTRDAAADLSRISRTTARI